MACFVDNISRCIFLDENCYILIQISLEYIPKGSVDNKPSLVQMIGAEKTARHYLDKWWPRFAMQYVHHSASVS